MPKNKPLKFVTDPERNQFEIINVYCTEDSDDLHTLVNASLIKFLVTKPEAEAEETLQIIMEGIEITIRSAMKEYFEKFPMERN